MPTNTLTITGINAAKPREKPYKLSDGGGMYLLVNPQGSMYWRLKYYFEGREKLLTLGVYPYVSLKQARSRRDEAKRAIADSVDPGAKRQAERIATADTFEAVAREWLALQEKKLAPATFARRRRTWRSTRWISQMPPCRWKIRAR